MLSEALALVAVSDAAHHARGSWHLSGDPGNVCQKRTLREGKKSVCESDQVIQQVVSHVVISTET
jgi:hypothetical protein